MPPSRIIIILAVVVLVLFGITLAVSTRTGRDQRAVPQAAWVEALKNLFLKNQKLEVQDISSRSPCLTKSPPAFVIEPGKPCEANIGESRKVVRKAKLTVKQGSKCTIDFVPADEEALPVHSTSGSVELSVMKKGGTLTITCSDAGGEKTALVNIE
jgi:hypothetical protein